MTNRDKKKLLCIYMLSGAFLIIMGALLLINENSIKSSFNNNSGKLEASVNGTCQSGYTLDGGMCYKCTSGVFNSKTKKCECPKGSTYNSTDKKCYSIAPSNKKCSSGTYTTSKAGTSVSGHYCTTPLYSTKPLSEYPTYEYVTVYFDANGGKCSSSYYDNVFRSYCMIDKVKGNYLDLDSRVAKRDGYYFEGWYTDPVGGIKISGSQKITKAVTYYAHWTAMVSVSSCDINITSSSYNYTGGSIKPEPTVTCSGKKITKGTDYNVSYSNNIKVGTATITITGKGKYTGRKVKTFKIVKTSKKTPEPATPATPATTTKKTYTVTYCNDSKCSKKKTVTATYGQVFNVLAYNTFTKTGYTNIKWTEKSSNGKKTYWTIENTNNKKWKWDRTSNVTLYATWQAHTYSIVFEKNNKTATGAMTDQKIKYGVKTAITKNKYKYKGYKFVKWNTKADGSGKSYTNGQKVSNLSSKNGDKIKLYAQWEPVKYTIKFNGNGGKGSMNNITKVYTKDEVAPANKFTRNGYVFTSWNTKRNGKGKTINEGQSIGNLSAVDGSTHTLYAQWVNENEKLNLKGGKYIVRKLNTTPATMRKIKVYKNAKMYSRKKKINENAKLKTGDTATISGNEYIFAIKGDTNKDGKITFPDITTSYAIFKTKAKKNELFYATDVNENGKIEFSDITSMYSMFKANNSK